MRVEDLVIGKEYYFDGRKKDKGIFKGKKSISLYFNPTVETEYLTETRGGEFKGCVGFLTAENMTPVEL